MKKNNNPRILLIMPKHREDDKTFPFGVATIYCTLMEKGHTVDFVDCVLEGKELDELVTSSQLQQYDIIGIGGLISAYKRVKHSIAPFIRKQAPQALIIIGGYLGISIPDRLLKNNLCDVVFLGDAEESIIEFMEVYQDRTRWKEIVGLSYLDADGSVVGTGTRSLKTLEKVYVPYYKYIDIERYNSHLDSSQRYYPLVVEYGCPFRCHFCFNSMGNLPRGRSAENVIEEIKVAMERYQPKEIMLMSENLLSRPSWTKRFCELIDLNGLKFRWIAAGHANTVNEDMLKLVKRHGCYKIGIGFENFSQKILDNMNKKVKVETYRRVMRMIRKHNFDYTGTMIFGYFGEDDQTIEENIAFCRDMMYSPTYFWIQAYPLTNLYSKCLQQGLIADEETYLEKLGDNTDFMINLTDYSTEELFSKRDFLHERTRINKCDPTIYFRLLRLYGPAHAFYLMFSALNRILRLGS